jgi:hypothetical protein
VAERPEVAGKLIFLSGDDAYQIWQLQPTKFSPVRIPQNLVVFMTPQYVHVTVHRIFNLQTITFDNF